MWSLPGNGMFFEELYFPGQTHRLDAKVDSKTLISSSIVLNGS